MNGIAADHHGYSLRRDSFVTAPEECNTRGSRNSLATPNVLQQESVGLTRREFIAAWVLLLVLHTLFAAYLLAMARLYFFMEDPRMIYYANLLALPQYRVFRLFGTLVGILGGLHTLQLVLHIAASIQVRSPVVWPRTAMVNRFSKMWRGLRKKMNNSTDTQSSRILLSIKRILSTLDDMLSVEGCHFALAFVLRKAVETVTQIFQCHHYSTLIARTWINHAYVGMVVANCVVTSLLNHMIISSEARAQTKVVSIDRAKRVSSIRERTLCVIVDTVLTTVSCFALPLAIFSTWARMCDMEQGCFSTEVLYSDTMFTSLVHENQAIFALSIIDALTKIVPHVSLVLGLTTISFILEQNSWQRPSTKYTIFVTAAHQLTPEKPRPCPVASTVAGSKSRQVKQPTKLRLIFHAIASLLFVLAGAVILGLHTRANYFLARAGAFTSQMCLQSVHPWFAHNVSCSVVKYNCYRLGVPSPPPDALENLQREALASIVFEHCSAFEMPTSIRDFPNLLGLELWNVTIVNWGVKAALNTDLHPKLGFLVMVLVNMTALPEGLLQAPFPKLLGDIEIVLTNLTTIPDEVADVWSDVHIVFVEYTPLKEFPAVLFRLPVNTVSLVGDGLNAMPDDLFTLDGYPNFYAVLVLSYNPLQAFPNTAREGMAIDFLLATHTELNTLPSWIEDTVDILMTLEGSPVCEDSGTELPDVVDCFGHRWSPTNGGYYPFALVEPTRKL